MSSGNMEKQKSVAEISILHEIAFKTPIKFKCKMAQNTFEYIYFQNLQIYSWIYNWITSTSDYSDGLTSKNRKNHLHSRLHGCEVPEGNLPGGKLPQEDGEAPHIGCLGVDHLGRFQERLGGHPGLGLNFKLIFLFL